MFGLSSKSKTNNGQNNILDKERNYILSNISKSNQWWPAGNKANKDNYPEIKENLDFLKKTLRLNNLEDQIMILERSENKEKMLSGFLTSRQMHCMSLINANVQEKNAQGAYHELYDFIESYKRLDNKPIDMVEKIIIRNAIIQIESILCVENDC